MENHLIMNKKATATAVYVVDRVLKEVLLAIKTRKVGIGCYFPYGGWIKDGETSRGCTCREVDEETKGKIILKPEELIYVGQIWFYKGRDRKPYQTEPTSVVDFYIVYKEKATIGIPPTTEEMRDPAWFAFDVFPPNIKKGDERFMLPMLNEQVMRGNIHFSKNEKVVYKDSYITSCTLESLILE